MTNPYAAPSSNPQGTNIQEANSAVGSAILSELRGTRGWTIFLAILAFIAGALLLLGGIFFIFAMSSLSGIGGFPIVFGLIYILFSLIYILPGIALIRYSSSIGRLLYSTSMPSLEEVISKQRSFWKTAALTMISIIILSIALAAITFVFVRRAMDY